MPSKEYEVSAEGTRKLYLSKLDDGNYQVRLHWGKGGRDLATLVFTPAEWKKLASYSEGLKKK